MTEVRVHAAFKVKDETTFLKEAAKIVEATQVKLYIHFFSGKCSAFEKYEKSVAGMQLFKGCWILCRLSKGASTTSCTRRQEEAIQAVSP